MRPYRRGGFWTALFLSGLCMAAAAMTLLWQGWIEVVFRVDPDGGNGSLEWLIVGVLVITSVVFLALANEATKRSPRHRAGVGWVATHGAGTS